MIRLDGTQRCAVCEAVKGLDAHHILDKRYWKEYKFEYMNGIALCKRCHKFGKFSAHRNGLWFSEWLKANRPITFKWVMEAMNGYNNQSIQSK